MTMTQSVTLSPVERAIVSSLPEEQMQYLTFTLGKEVFAAAILTIKEILRYSVITDVPMTHPCLMGMFNLRGRVVPIVDLALRLGRDPTDIGRRTCIVIAEVATNNGSVEIGIVVDAVRAVVDIPNSAVEPPPPFGIRLHADYMLGVTRLSDLFVVLLDLSKVLAMEELAALTHNRRGVS